MLPKRFEQEGRQLILHTDGDVCTTVPDLLASEVFTRVVDQYCDVLHEHDSPLIQPLLPFRKPPGDWTGVVNLLRALAEKPLAEVAEILPDSKPLMEKANCSSLHEFVEGLYDFWRSFDRFMVLHSEFGPSSFDQRPYRSFNATIETLTHVVRAAYRDICENITSNHPRVYRQVSAGCDVALIAVRRNCHLPDEYDGLLGEVPLIRQVWIAPPFVIDPPMNKRTGKFKKVHENPLSHVSLEEGHWLCYPANVGPLVIFVYFHQRFMGLGCSLADLFEMATDEQIAAGPDAIYLFGVPPHSLESFGDLPTVFFDDEANNLLVAAVPGEDRFGYFGYLKKMILTLHNIAMMKRGRMPYHGAMVCISLKDGSAANILIAGDTATGKSESLEAFRLLAEDRVRELRVVADDMGSLEVKEDGQLAAYGTEIGAFIRLDDLQKGYAFNQIDRAIIMSPQKENARVVVPVTTLEEVLHGHSVDFLLYANNYEQVDEDHPVLERFQTAQQAIDVFRQGTAMSKGTTTTSGLVHSYYANIFGPPQYKKLHEQLAANVFRAAFESGVYVGQLRTRLAISGYQTRGPEEAAKSLLSQISRRNKTA